jgi:hypothetical protein
VSDLLFDVGLRIAKVVVAVVIGVLIYFGLTASGSASGSAELAILAFLAGAAVVLLLEGGIN